VFGLIAMILVGTVISVFRSTQRGTVRTQAHLRGLQAVHALLDRLSLDLRGVLPFDNPYTDRMFQLEVHQDGRTLELHRYDPFRDQVAPAGPSGELALIPVQQVRYAFDPATGRLSRKVGQGREERLPAFRYQLVSFGRVDSPSPTPPGAAGRLGVRDVLQVQIEWVPEELLGRPPPVRGEVLRFVASLGLEGESLVRHHPDRMLNPTSKFGVESLEGP
jgi:hypothetical protein